MELNKNQAEVNWQYPMVHKYQAETKKCPSMQAEAKFQYLLVHKYQAEANTCLNI